MWTSASASSPSQAALISLPAPPSSLAAVTADGLVGQAESEEKAEEEAQASEQAREEAPPRQTPSVHIVDAGTSPPAPKPARVPLTAEEEHPRAPLSHKKAERKKQDRTDKLRKTKEASVTIDRNTGQAKQRRGSVLGVCTPTRARTPARNMPP